MAGDLAQQFWRALTDRVQILVEKHDRLRDDSFQFAQSERGPAAEFEVRHDDFPVICLTVVRESAWLYRFQVERRESAQAPVAGIRGHVAIGTDEQGTLMSRAITPLEKKDFTKIEELAEYLIEPVLRYQPVRK